MFVPYNGETQRFNVCPSDQRRHSAKTFQRRRREKAIRSKERCDAEAILASVSPTSSSQITRTSPDSSELTSATTDNDVKDDGDDDKRDRDNTIAAPEHTPPVSPSTTTASNTEGTTDVGKHQPRQEAHDLSVARSITHKLRAISRSDMTFGGFRVDPFRSYPIKWREYFPAVTDFCRVVVAPRPNYFQFVLNNDVLFEALVSYGLCVMPTTTPQTQMAMMYHYGSTMSRVSEFLSSSSERASDAVILAICNLAVICAYRGDDQHFDTHLKGIRQLIDLRGGKNAFEAEDSWVKTALIAIEALALVRPREHTRAITAETSKVEVGPNRTTLHISSRTPVYPKHPFPPDLCVTISRLQEGFREVALSGQISIQLVNRLEITRSQVVHLMATAADDERDRDWQALMRVSTPLERMGWFAVMVFHLRSSTHFDNCRSLAETVLECAQQGYSTVAESEWILWGACLLIATPDPEKELIPQRDAIITLLKQQRKASLSYSRMNAIANKFLWSEGLSGSLRTIVAQRLSS